MTISTRSQFSVTLGEWNRDAFAARLKTAIGSDSPYAFAKKCGIAESLMRKYLAGEATPGADKFVAMADRAGVRLEWLAHGRGPIRDEYEGVREGFPSFDAGGGAVDWDDLESVMIVLDLILQRRGVNKPNPRWRAAMTRKIYGYYREKVAGRDGLSPKDWATVMDIIENAIGESDAELNDTGATD